MAELKLEMSGAKLELNGSEELIKNESTRFYYALGMTDELSETTIHAAVEFCNQYGLEFDAVNENLPSVIAAFGGNDTQKIVASLYI